MVAGRLRSRSAAARAETHSSLPVRLQFLANPWGPPFGLGASLLVSDSGLDPAHCSFYQGAAATYLQLPMQGAVPAVPPTANKVLAVVSFEYLPGVYTDPAPYTGAHGTMTAGVSSALLCQQQEGVAPQDQVLFLDMTASPFNLVRAVRS